MALNVISNFAANVAHRNLSMSDAAATSSLTKLSSGTRVVSAKDDAASLAIGSRLKAEVVAMRTANVNTAQAGSMLQIADGAMSTISDMLVRMKELAVQASSGQYSSTERTILDSEYQALVSEVTRVSDDTEFNGLKLIAGAASTATNQLASDFTTSGNGYAVTVDPNKVADNTALRLSFDTVTAVAQVDRITIAGAQVAGEVYTVTLTDNASSQSPFTASYTVQAGDTADLVSDGLVTAINNVVGVTVTASDSGVNTLDLTANTAGNGFSISVTENSAAGTGVIANQTANVVGGDFLTLTNLTNADETTVDVAPILDAVVATAGTNLSGAETATVLFDSIGVTVTLNANFDRNTDNITTGAISAGYDTTNFTGATVTNDADGGVSNDALTALLALGSSVYDNSTGILTLTADATGATTTLAAAGIRLGIDGGAFAAAGVATADLVTASASTVEIAIDTANGITTQLAQLSFATVTSAGADATTIQVDLGELVFGTAVTAGASTTDFNFKVGTGNETYDSLTFTVNASSANALGLNNTLITTAANAETASTAVSAAIDTLNQNRSSVGAAQNRLTFASNNLATAIENAEAARSGLMDLDVAAEISNFTSKQILIQTGVAMLAQANQLPQNLLRLFQ